MEIYDLIVIGGGPGGYLCAERAAEEGMKVLLFEEREIGGTCLNEGCIPTKTLLFSAKMYRHATESKAFGVETADVVYHHEKVIARKRKVVRTLVGGVKAGLKARKVQIIPERAEIKGKEDTCYLVVSASGESYGAKKLCIASGSYAFVPPVPGAAQGLESGFVMTNREALVSEELPEKLVVIGGGVIGLEMACYYASVGVHVIIVEMLDKIAGQTDRDICKVLMDAYGKRGMEFYLSTKLLEIRDGEVLIERDGEHQVLACDKVLMSVGRRANTEGIGLENIGVERERGAIVVNEHLQTNVENVYAVGDCNGRIMLAHTAYREAEAAVNHMTGKEDEMDYQAIPSVIYTDPEVASVGYTLDAAKAAGIKAREVKIPMMYSGRYVAETERGTGFAKFVVDDEKRLIGVHMVGSYASELILSAEVMMGNKMTIEEMKKIIFPHPTVGEVLREGIFQI